MKNKIYTKTGDKGKTSLFGGKRVNKFDLRVETYGTVDELNSVIGIAISVGSKTKSNNNMMEIIGKLEQVQNDLFTIGSTLANPQNPSLPQLEKRIKQFEKVIDDITEQLPELKNFILPGGGLAGAQLHLARTICRRAERRIVELKQTEEIEDLIISYFNRLSDFLFTAARFVNHIEKQREKIWRL